MQGRTRRKRDLAAEQECKKTAAEQDRHTERVRARETEL